MQIPLYKLPVLRYKKKHRCILGKCIGINLFIDQDKVDFLDFPFQCSLMHGHWDDRGFLHHCNPFFKQLLFQVLQSFRPPHPPAQHAGNKVGGNLPPHTYLQKPEALSWHTFSSSWSTFSQAAGLTALLHKKAEPWKINPAFCLR